MNVLTLRRPFPPRQRRQLWPNRQFLLAMPITLRLTLGFLLAALLAALATWIIGSQHASTLSQQSRFYQTLLQIDTTLTDGSGLLKSLDRQTATLLDDATNSRSNEDLLDSDEQGLSSLMTRYNDMLIAYTSTDLLEMHPEQLSLLGSNPQIQIEQQRIYVAGALRTWHIYQILQNRILQLTQQGNTRAARELSRLQGEPAQADALSALHSLIQFQEQLATLVDQSAYHETNHQLLLALLGSIGAFVAISLIGLSFSRTVLLRLKQLHQVTQAVERGQTDARVTIKGRDEITDVSRSVNKMLNSLVEAIERTKTANQQLDHAYQQQIHLNQLKDHLIQNVSHELRTPLTEIYGFLQLMHEHQEHLDEAKRTLFLEHALSGCEELLSLLTTILDTAQIGATTRAPQIENLALSPLVEEVLEQCNPHQREEHPVSLDIASHLYVQADAQYIRQILRNLLSNAFKYTPVHTPVILRAHVDKASPGSTSPHPSIALCVQDAGPGIPPEEQAMLFQQFVRLKRDLSGTVRGTGLGLYLCRQLTKAMNGHIRVESSGIAGEGAAFWLTLPSAIPDQEKQAEERSYQKI